MLNRLLLTTIFGLSLVTVSHAGSIIQFETRDLQTNPPIVGTVTISTQGAMTRLDVHSPDSGGSASLIFDGNADQLIVLDQGQQKYFVMTRDQMDAMAIQVSDAMTQMEAALASMPPEQRKMAEQMMKSRMPVAQAVKPTSTVSKSSGGDTVAGYDCENYVATSEGRKIRDMCVTDWDDIDGGHESADALMDFADFFSNMREAFSGMGGMADVSHQQDIFEHLKALDGYPVLSRDYDDAGTLVNESRVTSARRENIDASLFAPPAGYQKQDIF